MAIGVGDPAPLIALKDADGIERRSDQLDGRALVLFFYPKDDTPGCTMEACAFRDSYQELQRPRRRDLGGQRRRRSQSQKVQRSSRPALSPAGRQRQSAEASPSSVPNAMLVLPGRVTYVIDGQGVIRHVFNNLLDGPAHRREALRALQELRAQGQSAG